MNNSMKGSKLARCVVGWLVLAGLLSLYACSSEKSQLIGKWKRVNDNDILEFFSDSRFSWDGQSGSWTIVNDGQVKLEANIYGQSYVFIGKREGEVLHLTRSDNGGKTEWQKLKN